LPERGSAQRTLWDGIGRDLTLIPVPALALEGMLVEIDVIAVVPR
jgi:hypothetical protein